MILSTMNCFKTVSEGYVSFEMFWVVRGLFVLIVWLLYVFMAGHSASLLHPKSITPTSRGKIEG